MSAAHPAAVDVGGDTYLRDAKGNLVPLTLEAGLPRHRLGLTRQAGGRGHGDRPRGGTPTPHPPPRSRVLPWTP